MTRIEVRSIAFSDEGIAIDYIELPTDVRVEGRLALTHQIQLHASHPDYRADMESIRDLAVRAIRNGLEDFENSVPYDPAGESEDDDERGMGE